MAGLIAASRNEFGTTGVAWGAFITGVPVLDMGVADMNDSYAGFLQALDQVENFDIVNNSWGRLPGFWQGYGVPERDAEFSPNGSRHSRPGATVSEQFRSRPPATTTGTPMAMV